MKNVFLQNKKVRQAQNEEGEEPRYNIEIQRGGKPVTTSSSPHLRDITVYNVSSGCGENILWYEDDDRG